MKTNTIPADDRRLIAELIAEHDRLKANWRALTFDRIAEKFGVSTRTVHRIADEARLSPPIQGCP